MRKIAVVVAHSDDAELSMGGTLFKYRHLDPLIIHTSRSDYKNFNGEVHRTLEQVQKETNDAMEKLGITREPICFPYPTKEVPYNSELIQCLDEVFHENHIDTVFTHNPDDTHADHKNTAQAVLTACRRISNLYTFEPVFPANSLSLFQPQMYMDISGEPYIRKIQSLIAHESQYAKYGVKWLDSVNALSRLRGIEIGVPRAEAFCVIKGILEL